MHDYVQQQCEDWIFGPPDSNDVDGRAFYSTAQPNKIGSSSPRTFPGILTHEIGHAVELAHPDDSYAVMAQNFRTWFRGPNHILRTRLLPDDTAGILALYPEAGVSRPFDLSATATWYKSAEQQFNTCTTQIAQVNAAARVVSQATGVPVDGDFPADKIFKGEHADLFQALANAQDALRACEDSKNAIQAADSATIGQMFRLPASIASGETLYVFVRAIPYDVNRTDA